MTFSWFIGQDSLNRPAVMQPAGDDAFTPPEPIRPLLNVHGFTTKCQQPVVAPVVGLLLGGCPSAVLRRVVAVVVDAVKPSARRRITHVGMELGKGFTPAITDPDSASTIANEGRVFFAVAAAKHPTPCAVLAWLCRFAQAVAPSQRSSLALCLRQTATGLRSSAFQIVRSGYLFAAAVARAFPQRLPAIRCTSVTRNNQLSKPRSSQVNVSHSIGPRLCVPLIIT